MFDIVRTNYPTRHLLRDMEKIGEGIIAITFRKVTFPTAILWTFESAITLRDSPSKVSKAGWLDWLQSGRFLLDAMSSCAFDAWARQKPETCIIMHHHASSCIIMHPHTGCYWLSSFSVPINLQPFLASSGHAFNRLVRMLSGSEFSWGDRCPLQAGLPQLQSLQRQ